MKICLLGKDGQLGWELQRALSVLGEVYALGREDADLADLGHLGRTIEKFSPDIIVNAAAYTAVDKAESESELAARINGEAPAALARLAQACGAWLVHYSTDYVFDGSGTLPWHEQSTVGPLSVYGKTKLAGEQGVRAAHTKHLIFRTSWVYATRGGNFAKTMLRLAQERTSLNVVNDQIGAPTSAELLADITAQILGQTILQKAGDEIAGTYHLAAAGETSWFDYAKFVLNFAEPHLETLQVKASDIQAVSTEAFPLPAPRPRNSRLDTTKLRNTFGLTLPPWQTGVTRMLTEHLGL